MEVINFKIFKVISEVFLPFSSKFYFLCANLFLLEDFKASLLGLFSVLLQTMIVGNLIIMSF